MCDELFPNRSPKESAKALSRALSLARASLSKLGGGAHALLRADRTFVWADLGLVKELDLDVHEDMLRSALVATPGKERDDLLARALEYKGVLLEDEPYASWAIGPRECLDVLRQQARLALARGLARGEGRAQLGRLIEAWEDCLANDPACEEAATELIRAYAAQNQQALVERTYRSCRTALDELGVHFSPVLEEAHDAATLTLPCPSRAERTNRLFREGRRHVSVVFAELAGPLVARHLEPEELRDLLGRALEGVVARVEAFGGTVTAVTGAGLVALFGAPDCHEDDPERALRVAFGAVASASSVGAGISLRAGVETGLAVVGRVGGSPTGHYAAIGEAVVAAAALQAAAGPGRVLVGPTTRAETEGLFDWGPRQEVPAPIGGEPLRASYLERPKARPFRHGRLNSLGRAAPLVGRGHELSVLRKALQEATAGRGGVVAITGEPGLGKTRLVEECHKLFLGWVAAAKGRLPLWLEASAASYAATTPYGLYQRLLSAWVGAAPEEGEEVARLALERAVKAAFGANAVAERLELLSQVMSVTAGKEMPARSRLDPKDAHQAMFEAIGSLVTRLVSYGPTVLVLEDLQWADPISVRLTKELISLTEDGPLLMVLTRRPEPDHRALDLERAISAARSCLKLRSLELAPLTEPAERCLARTLLGAITDEVLDAVTAGTDGNPMFLTERIASLLETPSPLRDEAEWSLKAGASGELSAAIERLVRCRLDRLEPSPRDAVLAAPVLGPEFTPDKIGAITDLNEDIAQAVSELCMA